MNISQNRVTFLLFFFAVGGIGLFLSFYEEAFPQAALRVAISKNDAETRALDYLREKGFSVSDYHRVTIFDGESSALEQIFLQKAWGFEQFNHALRTDPELHPWGFITRFFKPLEKEEFRVGVSPSGTVFRFAHDTEETAAGARLSKSEARVIGDKFLTESLNITAERLIEKDYREEKLANRTDHHFSFELSNSEIKWSDDQHAGKGAKRINLSVQGDAVGAFDQYVFVPEDFARLQDREDAQGFLLTAIAVFFLVLLGISALVLFLRNYRERNIFFGYVSILIGTGVVLAAADALNTSEQLFFLYDTSSPLLSFLSVGAIFFLALTLFFALVHSLFGTVGEALTREIFPSANALDPRTRYPAFLIWKDTFRGITLAGILLGYITLFYAVSSRFFSVWSPLDAGIAAAFTGVLSFVSIMLVSFGAAVEEEFTFRLFGVSLGKKYLKYTFLALLLPAFIWAFLHSAYAVYPSYVRGIELTIGGIIFGYAFIRFGILSVMIAHYLVNASLFAVPLVKSGVLSYQISGIIGILGVFLFPLLYQFVFPLVGKVKK